LVCLKITATLAMVNQLSFSWLGSFLLLRGLFCVACTVLVVQRLGRGNNRNLLGMLGRGEGEELFFW